MLRLVTGALVVTVIFAALVSIAPSRAAVAPHESAQSWRPYVTAVDDALARDDVSAAVRAWHDAYGIGLASRRWEAMIDVGDAFLRVSAKDRSHDGGKPNARQAYLVALLRAERARSVEGVQRVAQAFAALGDHDVAAQCLRIAEKIGARS